MFNQAFTWQLVRSAPATVAIAALVSNLGVLAPRAAQAAEVPAPTSVISDVSTVANLQTLGTEAVAATSGMEQVTSVSQLSDVKPTDWAFQSLQSLVERYGCIAGYPDKTFRGNRALTRYEFAAGLNSCMDRINELIGAGTADLVKKEDLEALKKLQEEFAAELAALRGRVDALEARTSTLEKQQFSTTTKLQGNVWMNLSGAGASKRVTFEGPPGSASSVDRFFNFRDANGVPSRQTTDSPSPTFSFLTWLTLNTSFSGKDLLVTQLAAGNGASPANQYASAGFFNSFGTPFFDQTGGTATGVSNVVIHDLFYSFPLNDSIKVTVGPRINWYRHFDFNRFNFIFNSGASFDSSGHTQANAIDRGSGAVVEWNINKKLRFAVGYLGENTEFLPPPLFNSSSNPAQGLFGGTNTTSAELTFSPNDKINLRFLYTYSRIQGILGLVGGATGEPIPYGFLDDGKGGPADHATANMFGVNFDWMLTKGIGIFGRYSFANTRIQPIDGKVRTQSFQVGLGFPDLGKKGALGTLTFLMPMDITRGSRYFVSGAGDGGTMYTAEASYFYPMTDNIALVPTFYTIFNANNFDSNPTIFVGSLRAQFSF